MRPYLRRKTGFLPVHLDRMECRLVYLYYVPSLSESIKPLKYLPRNICISSHLITCPLPDMCIGHLFLLDLARIPVNVSISRASRDFLSPDLCDKCFLRITVSRSRKRGRVSPRPTDGVRVERQS